ADSFNDMSEKVKILFSEISRQKEELKNIITSIQEGLAVIGRGGRIKVCNDSFKDITGNQSPEGDFYWKVLRGPESLNTAIKDAQIKRAGFQQEVFLSNRAFICNGSFLSELDDVVITFYDITDIKKLENIKKDFVVNVSHELKTPLTAVKGYLETIYDEAADETRGYLDIVLRHTDRLINIVNDLLLLSKLEDAEKIKAENINITEILDNVLSIFKARIKEKGLRLNVKISGSLGTVKADYFKLEQLLINLIDNAVKYTERGGITVEVEPNNGSIAIKIKDTGIGIPKECLDRIFERFFVVDKSHSKESSGTGLGLAIAKHIVSLHKGSIRVESSLSEGSVFTVFLPVNQA
ncbi:MAG: ATP-binding protein, partial [Candidatus Omnitrophica bacterium]|nr:ATP-binding protein [Candidatus Omnitrophota bacterium]